AVIVDRVLGGDGNPRIGSQAQGVVRAEVDERMTVDRDLVAALRADARCQCAAEPAPIEVGKRVIEPGKRIRHDFVSYRSESDPREARSERLSQIDRESTKVRNRERAQKDTTSVA